MLRALRCSRRVCPCLRCGADSALCAQPLAEYSLVHSPEIVTEHLDPAHHLGPLLIKEPLSTNAPPSAPPASAAALSTPELQRQLALSLRPPLSEVLSLHDFESIARQVMSGRGWAYYSSGADDESTMRENRGVYGRVWMRPRVLRNVVRPAPPCLLVVCGLSLRLTETALASQTNVDLSTTILGQKSSMPIYITATVRLTSADGA